MVSTGPSAVCRPGGSWRWNPDLLKPSIRTFGKSPETVPSDRIHTMFLAADALDEVDALLDEHRQDLRADMPKSR